MDIRKIKKLIELVENSNLEELEVKSGDEAIRLKKHRHCNSMASVSSQGEKVETIFAPLAGTFYRAPAKDTSAYVSEGSVVAKGDTLGLIEASTLMNKVYAKQDGIVDKILVKNGQTVESGQALLLVLVS